MRHLDAVGGGDVRARDVGFACVVPHSRTGTIDIVKERVESVQLAHTLGRLVIRNCNRVGWTGAPVNVVRIEGRGSFMNSTDVSP